RYVLNPVVFEALGSTRAGAGKEIQLTDAIKRTLESDRVVAIEFEGDYYDTGTIPGYLKANLALAPKRQGVREELIQPTPEPVEDARRGRARRRRRLLSRYGSLSARRRPGFADPRGQPGSTPRSMLWRRA